MSIIIDVTFHVDEDHPAEATGKLLAALDTMKERTMGVEPQYPVRINHFDTEGVKIVRD